MNAARLVKQYYECIVDAPDAITPRRCFVSEVAGRANSCRVTPLINWYQGRTDRSRSLTFSP